LRQLLPWFWAGPIFRIFCSAPSWHRLACEPHLDRSRDDLMRLASADILTSPIFSLLGIDE
jgi:hypothetical protein